MPRRGHHSRMRRIRPEERRDPRYLRKRVRLLRNRVARQTGVAELEVFHRVEGEQ